MDAKRKSFQLWERSKNECECPALLAYIYFTGDTDITIQSQIDIWKFSKTRIQDPIFNMILDLVILKQFPKMVWHMQKSLLWQCRHKWGSVTNGHWPYYLITQIAQNVLSHMFFNVKLNFKVGLFSSIFFFEDSLLCKSVGTQNPRPLLLFKLSLKMRTMAI